MAKQMSRALRRRIEKSKISGDLVREIMQFSIGTAVEDYGVAVVMVLLDKADVPKEKIPEFLQAVSVLFDSILSGHVDIDDLHATIFDETGISMRGGDE